MSRVLRLAPLLLRGRVTAGRGLVDLLATVAFAVSSWLLLTVVAGVAVFARRQQVPPATFVDALGDRAALGVAQLPTWTMLATCAGVLLIVPVATLGAGAARMGALGRDQRLAGLRLLGVSGRQVVALSTVETMVLALVGTVLGALGYLATAPAWAAVTFQATPLSAAQMRLPAWAVVTVGAGLVLLAGLASATGLARLRISPLGVARRQPRPGLRFWRVLLLPVVIVVWLAVAPTTATARQVVGTTITATALLVFMGVVNLVGPWLLQAMSQAMTLSGRPAVLLAGRRLAADPRGAWRSVSGLAFVGFTGGALLSLPDLSGTDDPMVRLFGADLRTGTVLTLVVAFVVAATSTLLNQAAAVLDRRQELAQLGNLGVPLALHDRTRAAQVLAPAALAAVGSSALAAFFFSLVSRFGPSPTGQLMLVATLAAGLVLVWLASQTCRPLLRSVVATAGPRPD